MFSSVLVPLDGSAFAEKVLPLAEMVGRVAGTQVHLVCVDGDGDKEAYLRQVAARLGEEGVSANHSVLDGKVVDALEERAKAVGADLIVMTTHGRSGLDRLRLGSVAEGLVTRGVAPMLLLHPSADGTTVAPKTLDHVVVALDQSSYAVGILEPLESLAKAAGVSRVTLVHVAENRGAGTTGWTPVAAVQARVVERVAPIRERLGALDVDVDVEVVLASEPSDGILGVAEHVGADLIAMTTHGMTGLRPTLVGSVAAQVLRKWTGPLLLQRPRAE